MANVVEETVYIVGHNESGNSYTSINPTDVISIGLFNWYGARALNIARQIVALDPSGSESALSSASNPLYQQITSGNNNVWNSYHPTNSQDRNALKNFLDLSASHTVQDNQSRGDASGYISQAKARGITDEAAQIYFADLYNQSPKQAGNIVNACKSGGAVLNLANLHKYAMQNSVMKKYSTRRNWTYNELVGWTGEEVVTPPVNPPSENGGDGTAGNLPPSAANVSDYILKYNEILIRYSADNPQGTVYIPAGNVFIPKTQN